MTEDRLPLAELLAKAGDGDFLRSVAEAVVQLLIETDVEGLIGAGRHERSGDRTHIPERLPRSDARHAAGQPCSCAFPKLRQGSYFPAFLEPRKDFGEGPGRGDPGSLGRWRLDPARR